jgi:hypothetical protein
VDSETLKQWGRNTFIVVAARRAFATAHPAWVQRISKIKWLLDESWLLSKPEWTPGALPANANYLTSIASLAGLNSTTVAHQVQVHKYMIERDFSSTATQLSCEELAHPSNACPFSQRGTANAVAATANFFLSQKGLATVTPRGRYVDTAVLAAANNASLGSNPWFASMIDPSILYQSSAGGQVNTASVTTDLQNLVTNPWAPSVVPTEYSVESGACPAFVSAVTSLALLPSTSSTLSGVISDKGTGTFPAGASYRDNLHCLWAIRAATGSNWLRLNFTSLRVWSGDIVRVYEVPVNSGTPAWYRRGRLMAQLSGIDHTWPILRTGNTNHVLVEFKTDNNAETCYNSAQGDGWSLSYDRAVTGCSTAAQCSGHGQCIGSNCVCNAGWGGADCSYSSCLGTTVATAASGVFQSDANALSQSNLYPNDAECVFISRGNSGQVVEFDIVMDLEDTFDFVTLQAGPAAPGSSTTPHARLTGEVTRTVVVPTDSFGDASLRFTTDNKGRRSGFRAAFRRRTASSGSSQNCAHLNSCQSTSQGHCVSDACVCTNGWAGFDCSSPTCTAQVLHAGKPWSTAGTPASPDTTVADAGVRRSGINGLIPPVSTCQWQLNTGRSVAIAGVRLYLTKPGTNLTNRQYRAAQHPSDHERAGLMDIEPSRRGSANDFVTISTAGVGTPISLALQLCDRDEECAESWQSGQCEIHYTSTKICSFKQSVDIIHARPTTSTDLIYDVSLITDRNDGTETALGGAPTGMSLGWELIQVCIARDQWTNADPGEDAEYVCTGGSCDCEMAGGTCSALGACLLRDQASACSCGGVLSRVDKDGGIPGWLFPVIAVLVLAMIALACKYWRSKKGKRRKENKISELERRMHDMQNVDSELDNVNKIIADAQKKAAELMARRAVMQEIPHTWDPRVPDDQNIIELQPNDEQYWVVSDRLRETMQDAWVSKVWRIQNNDLWNYYSFHKGRLANQGFDEERHVWHGTSGLDPSCIYNDQQDGFMVSAFLASAPFLPGCLALSHICRQYRTAVI